MALLASTCDRLIENPGFRARMEGSRISTGLQGRPGYAPPGTYAAIIAPRQSCRSGAIIIGATLSRLPAANPWMPSPNHESLHP